jgi:hypothetical protein
MAKTDLSLTAEYLQWFAENGVQTSPQTVKNWDPSLKKKIAQELKVQSAMDSKENTLYHKYLEIRDWLPQQKIGDLRWVERLIWKPKGKSDYRRIKPELIQVNPTLTIPSYDIWGNQSLQEIGPTDPLLQHWQILRTLVSAARNDGFPGRLLRFLVRDKVTKTYLGVISISSDMLDLTARNKSIGADIGKLAKDNLPFNCTANGQTIVPTQPFGSAYLGVKLLALLCLSKEVADAWKREYGDTLVGVTTTSLYGESGVNKQTAYDGLTPYWRKMGTSQGNAPIKLPDVLFNEVRDWMFQCNPVDYYRVFIKSKRERKTRAHQFVYRYFGFKDALKSNFIRNVYFSRLYKNTDEYIRSYVECAYDNNVRIMPEEKLVPAFDNSIEALIEHWRFGHATDTTTLKPEIAKKYGATKENDNVRRLVKGRIDRNYKDKQIQTEGSGVDWYEAIGAIPSWVQARKQFLVTNED